MPSEPEAANTGLERLLFFSDAVFAIAITLLALDLRLPAQGGALNDSALALALLAAWPKYLSFAVSFLVVGLFWSGHHRRFSRLQGFDRRLIWLNLLLLMGVAFIPFPTAVLSEYGNRTATIFYALSIAAVGGLSAGVYAYARRLGYLKPAGRAWAGSLGVPGVFLLSAGVALWNADLAKLTWLLTLPLILAAG